MLFRRKHAASPTQGSEPAAAEVPCKPRRTAGRVIREWLTAFALVAAISIPIRSSIADWNDVPSGSMRPTILEGDRIYVNLLAYGLRIPFTTSWLARWDAPKRGEIVTMKSPADGVRLVKRVIGLPGDHIAMQGNRLVINGAPSDVLITDPDETLVLEDGRKVNVALGEENLNDDRGLASRHALTLTPGALSPHTFSEIVVPEGKYFMMGDNRDMSRDSRMIGFVPLESIYGRSRYVALSLDPGNSYWPRWERWFSAIK